MIVVFFLRGRHMGRLRSTTTAKELGDEVGALCQECGLIVGRHLSPVRFAGDPFAA
jgi:hypothetical protein